MKRKINLNIKILSLNNSLIDKKGSIKFLVFIVLTKNMKNREQQTSKQHILPKIAPLMVVHGGSVKSSVDKGSCQKSIDESIKVFAFVF